MKLTNKLGLPEALVNAVANDPYTRGKSDISVTQLIDSPRIRMLNKQHEVEEDVADRIWSLLGQSVHTILERADSTSLKEERLFTDIGGWTLSGQYDSLCVMGGILEDYKVTSAWSVIYGSDKWEPQLNVLRYLAVKNGYDIKELRIVAILRDWNRHKAKEPNYPSHQVAIVPVPMWTMERTEEYIRERIKLHQEAEAGNLPDCTREEQWRREDSWAVMKEGRKTAVRVFDDEEAAQKHLQGMDPKHYIEHRVGQAIRCEDFCPFGKMGVCDQYKRENQ